MHIIMILSMVFYDQYIGTGVVIFFDKQLIQFFINKRQRDGAPKVKNL